MLTRDRDAVATNNDDLLQELAMYKSVMVPIDNKPRTNITRIGRLPLANQTLIANGADVVDVMKSINGSGETQSRLSTLDPMPDEMTLDEIM